ncbi:(2Fe-2S)-binding protein [Asticcacaulis sp. 201]|uniref:(2Fe-2S)-binding protein n=1 Tax=Asticcacaulis sp. 201 TaxID=3028787 RepID=UPI002916D88D|nr:2Fe-2S iron-sulfur cluster-binding protein [Asticcacaulis sp. 201]MDV6331614.1 (2Fe-2S)-binding protein [Asticcacaulis sp. 201]
MLTLNINGKPRQLDVPEDMPLLWALRDVLDLKGTKFGCGVAQCGACTVHVDGEATRACVTPVGTVLDAKITTIEGVGASPQGKALQAAWLDLDVMQCGYCQAGQIMTAAALLARTSKPDDTAIDDAMEGNLCRCATYKRIRAAIKTASGQSADDRREA